MTNAPTATSEYALAIFRAAELTDNEMHELVGRLTVLAPSALVEAVRRTKADRR